MLRTILEHPNKKLRKKSDPIFSIDESTNQLAIDLIDTCNIMFGAGLAAPQIGINKRMVVIKPSNFDFANPDPAAYNPDYLVLINPVLDIGEEEVEWKEACLSLPGASGKVKRSKNASVTYLDLEGNTKKIDAPWPFSGGLQHEIDHLDGILYIHRQDKRRSRSTMFQLQRVRRKKMLAARKERRMRK